MESPSCTSEPKIYRRTFLVDRKFQLKYTFIIVLVGVVVSAILGFFVYKLTMENTSLVDMDSDLPGQVAPFDFRTMIYLVGFVVAMALFLFVWGIFITHRVAGPIFVISRYLSQMAEGHAPKTRPLRRRDELKDFFEIFSKTISALNAAQLKEAEILEKNAEKIRQAGSGKLDDCVSELLQLAANKKAWNDPKDS